MSACCSSSQSLTDARHHSLLTRVGRQTSKRAVTMAAAACTQASATAEAREGFAQMSAGPGATMPRVTMRRRGPSSEPHCAHRWRRGLRRPDAGRSRAAPVTGRRV
jgi:hypothetical protein